MIYNAPIKDMMFLVDEWIGVDKLTSLAGFEDFDRDTLEFILEEAGKFCSTEVLPTNRDGDEHGAVFADGKVTTPPGFKSVYDKFVENGWTGIDADPKFGGQGLPLGDTAIASEAMDELVASADVDGKKRALVNLATDHSSSYFLLFSVKTVKLRADVAEFQ